MITDPSNGQVLAMVSYPGYDNNRLANTMDSDYYAQLNSMTSSPLYNKATQERTAPGSTYKPLVSIAGLTEEVISTGTTISCTGIFDKISPIARCWICLLYTSEIEVEQSEKHKFIMELSLEGAFLSEGSISEKKFKQLVAVNGAAAIIGIARGKIETLTANIFNNGKIVIPFVNVIDYYKSME